MSSETDWPVAKSGRFMDGLARHNTLERCGKHIANVSNQIDTAILAKKAGMKDAVIGANNVTLPQCSGD